MAATKKKCKAILCEKTTGRRYCRKHCSCEVAEAFGAKLRPLIEHIPGAAFVPSYLDDDEQGWKYTLNTAAGKLDVTFYAGDFALYARFDEPLRASKLLGGHGFLMEEVNPYSGKWNHHIADGHDVDSAVTYIMVELSRTRPSPQE